MTLATANGVSLNDWTDRFAFANPDDALPGSDPDGDGIVNLMEFAFGGNPLEFEADLAPELVVVTLGAQRHIGLRYRKPAGPQLRLNLAYVPERSPGAAPWTADGFVTHATEPPDASGRERITVRLTETIDAATRRQRKHPAPRRPCRNQCRYPL